MLAILDSHRSKSVGQDCVEARYCEKGVFVFEEEARKKSDESLERLLWNEVVVEKARG